MRSLAARRTAFEDSYAKAAQEQAAQAQAAQAQAQETASDTTVATVASPLQQAVHAAQKAANVHWHAHVMKVTIVVCCDDRCVLCDDRFVM